MNHNDLLEMENRLEFVFQRLSVVSFEKAKTKEPEHFGILEIVMKGSKGYKTCMFSIVLEDEPKGKYLEKFTNRLIEEIGDALNQYYQENNAEKIQEMAMRN